MLISRKRNPVLCLKPLQLEKEDQIFSYWTFTVLLGVLLRCYKARVTSVEYNKVPEKAYVFTFAELGSF